MKDKALLTAIQTLLQEKNPWKVIEDLYPVYAYCKENYPEMEDLNFYLKRGIEFGRKALVEWLEVCGSDRAFAETNKAYILSSIRDVLALFSLYSLQKTLKPLEEEKLLGLVEIIYESLIFITSQVGEKSLLKSARVTRETYKSVLLWGVYSDLWDIIVYRRGKEKRSLEEIKKIKITILSFIQNLQGFTNSSLIVMYIYIILMYIMVWIAEKECNSEL